MWYLRTGHSQCHPVRIEVDEYDMACTHGILIGSVDVCILWVAEHAVTVDISVTLKCDYVCLCVFRTNEYAKERKRTCETSRVFTGHQGSLMNTWTQLLRKKANIFILEQYLLNDVAVRKEMVKALVFEIPFNSSTFQILLQQSLVSAELIFAAYTYLTQDLHLSVKVDKSDRSVEVQLKIRSVLSGKSL